MLLSDNYQRTIGWIFDNNRFEYIMTCLIGLESKDQKIYDYLYDERRIIDRVTGEKIAFIYPVEEPLMSNAKHPVLLRSEEAAPFMTSVGGDRSVLRNKINDLIYDECDRIFSFDFNQLPGLVVIGRHGDRFPQFYHVDSAEEIKLYMDALAIIDSYDRDDSKYRDQLTALLSKEVKEDLECELARLREDRSEGAGIEPDSVIAGIVALLKSQSVSEEDIDRVERSQNLQQVMGALNARYPALRDSQEMRRLCKDVRLLQKKQTAEERIPDLERRLQDAVCKQEIEELREKRKKVKQISVHKLTRIVLEEKLAEEFLGPTYYASIDLYKLCRAISERSRKVLNRIRSFEDELETLGYDVFISCKSEDYQKAHCLYDFLLQNGHKPFLADYSLREVGTDRYGELIRQVIDRCKHMVVFASDIDYIRTEYVKHEWTLFYDEVMAGRKRGQLFAVVPTLRCMAELPIEFRNTQCFEIDSFDKTILDFMKE